MRKKSGKNHLGIRRHDHKIFEWWFNFLWFFYALIFYFETEKGLHGGVQIGLDALPWVNKVKSISQSIVCMNCKTVPGYNNCLMQCTRGALPYWVIFGMCSQNRSVFEAINLQMGVNFCLKAREWVII